MASVRHFVLCASVSSSPRFDSQPLYLASQPLRWRGPYDIGLQSTPAVFFATPRYDGPIVHQSQ